MKGEFTLEEIIKIPERLNMDIESYNYLSELQDKVLNSTADRIILDFCECKYTDASFTAFIGALNELSTHRNKKIIFRTARDSKVQEYFKRSGLYNYIVNDENKYINENAIPFSHVTLDDDIIIEYIDKILELAPIQLSSDCNNLLFRNIYEIFNNSIDHSDSICGVYSCGHWMPYRKELVFSIYDTGIGIAQIVKNNINPLFSSEEAIKWALIRGNSTKQLDGGTPRGLGLSDLLNFIKLNNGSLRIMSNDIYYKYNRSENYSVISKPIIGTLISITIIADNEHTYVVKKKEE